jgi:heptosyltransferase-1
MAQPSLRILLVRLSAVGDVIHGLPILCALREHLPTAHLAWAVHPPAAPLLRGHSALDELIVVSRPWRQFVVALRQLRSRPSAAAFDLALDLQGLTKSALVAWASRAPRRIGFAAGEGRELSTWLNNERVEPAGAHVIERTLTLLRPLGIHSPRVRFDLPRFAADAKLIDRLLPGHGRGLAVLNPGAGWQSKRWPHRRFAAVARHLDRHWGLEVWVVWAGKDERSWAEEIVAAARASARLAPPTTLPQLAALLRRACLFVGSDTGPLHLAAAVGTPCVALFGPTFAVRNGPYGPQHQIVQKIAPPESTHPPLMEAITPEEVCRACDRALNRLRQAA